MEYEEFRWSEAEPSCWPAKTSEPPARNPVLKFEVTRGRNAPYADRVAAPVRACAEIERRWVGLFRIASVTASSIVRIGPVVWPWAIAVVEAAASRIALNTCLMRSRVPSG